MGSDPRQIAEEFSRIEREYEGTVELGLFRNAELERYRTLNVRFFISVGLDGTSLRDFWLIHCTSFSVGIFEIYGQPFSFVPPKLVILWY